jgi:alpha-D-ribose 1-methylphosphonate 5-triphosphate synthase subunit PhnG
MALYDMVLTSTSQTELQAAFDRVIKWAKKNELRLNEEKTVSMTFRRGGRSEPFYIGTKQLKSVTKFTYLGVTLQTTDY